MVRKLCVALIALAIPFLAASAASAQDPQYPPTGDDPVVLDRGADNAAGDNNVQEAAVVSDDSLARTGSDTLPLTTIAVVLVGAGAVAVIGASISRRRAGA